MADYMAEAFAPAEARYKAAVLADTWGHLAPKKNIIYRGTVRFAIGIFGSDDLNPLPFHCDLKRRNGEELSSSPWFYDALNEFMQDFASEGKAPGEESEKAGKVFEWSGYFRNYQFVGTFREMEVR